MRPEMVDGLGVVDKDLDDVELVVVLSDVCLVERHAEHLVALCQHLKVLQLRRSRP